MFLCRHEFGTEYYTERAVPLLPVFLRGPQAGVPAGGHAVGHQRRGQGRPLHRENLSQRNPKLCQFFRWTQFCGRYNLSRQIQRVQNS